jgi:hypothetical protein
MGETAMGWSDCADPCNDENYGTIARYIGPFGLDGQFDFVLYHGVSTAPSPTREGHAARRLLDAARPREVARRRRS